DERRHAVGIAPLRIRLAYGPRRTGGHERRRDQCEKQDFEDECRRVLGEPEQRQLERQQESHERRQRPAMSPPLAPPLSPGGGRKMVSPAGPPGGARRAAEHSPPIGPV